GLDAGETKVVLDADRHAEERLVGMRALAIRDRGTSFSPDGDNRVERVEVRIVRRNRAERLTAEIDRRHPAIRDGRPNLRDAVRAPHEPRTRGTFTRPRARSASGACVRM